MEHGKKQRKFGRETKQRAALMRSLAVSLIEKDRIKTTLAKAKSIRPYVEKIITRGKNENLSSIRILSSLLPKNVVKKVFKEISPRYVGRNGGYTRIRQLPPRMSDGARLAIIEFV